MWPELPAAERAASIDGEPEKIHASHVPCHRPDRSGDRHRDEQPADAVTVVRGHYSHGTASCQSALPVFDGNIRKRPLAFVNEGTGSAFVPCDTDSFTVDAEGTFTLISAYFGNNGTGRPSIGCTLVNVGAVATTYVTKTTGPMAPGEGGFILWSTSDNDGELFRAPAVSCNLPPQTQIDAVGFAYREDIGS